MRALVYTQIAENRVLNTEDGKSTVSNRDTKAESYELKNLLT